MQAKKKTIESQTSLCIQAVNKRTGKGKWGFRKSQSWNEKSSKGSKGGGKNSWQKGNGKKGSKGQEEVAQEKRGHVGRAARQKTLQLGARKEATRICTQQMKMTVKTSRELAEDKDDLQAWCLLEENENEQWQEVMSRRNKQRVKRANQASLLWRAIKV